MQWELKARHADVVSKKRDKIRALKRQHFDVVEELEQDLSSSKKVAKLCEKNPNDMLT